MFRSLTVIETSPEPDFAILKDARVRRKQQPYGDELTLLIEVSDTTLRHDATTKRDLYARAGVHEYWVIDLAGRRVLVHRRRGTAFTPKYPQ